MRSVQAKMHCMEKIRFRESAPLHCKSIRRRKMGCGVREIAWCGRIGQQVQAAVVGSVQLPVWALAGSERMGASDGCQ